jgi:tetratricopeptide (TPR) repeat protein
MMASEGDTPSIETTFEAWLRAVKQGAPWEDALMALQRCVQVMQSRKNWIRANIVLAKTAKEKEQAAWCAQQAGDTLWALMNRPNLALACYRFAAERSEDPTELFGHMAKIEAHIEALANMPPEEASQEIDANILQGPWGAHGPSIQVYKSGGQVDVMGDNETGPSWLMRITQLWQKAQKEVERNADKYQEYLANIADTLACFQEPEGQPSHRVERTEHLWSADEALRTELIRALRGGEHYEPMIPILEFQEKLSAGEDKRNVLMELGSITRMGLDDPKLAATYFDQIIKVDKDDREAWGEYIECMEEIGDQKQLLDAISKRCARAQGLERRQLMRRRIELLMEAGELKPPTPPGSI